MMDGQQAFFDFKRLARSLRDWGFDVREQEEFGEFSINGYVCSFRYLGILDIDFLDPGQTLQSRQQPDMVLDWDGRGWREITQSGPGEISRPNLELFNRCLKRLNYQVAPTLGFSPHMCVLAPTWMISK